MLRRRTPRVPSVDARGDDAEHRVRGKRDGVAVGGEPGEDTRHRVHVERVDGEPECGTRRQHARPAPTADQSRQRGRVCERQRDVDRACGEQDAGIRTRGGHQHARPQHERRGETHVAPEEGVRVAGEDPPRGQLDQCRRDGGRDARGGGFNTARANTPPPMNNALAAAFAKAKKS